MVNITLKDIELGENNKVIEIDGEEYNVSVALYPSSNKGLHREEAWLRTEYVDKGKTMAEIGAMCGVTAMAVNAWLNKHNIETRARGQRKSL